MASASADPQTAIAVTPPTHGHSNMAPFVDFLGGVAGGTASVYVGQSLDTVKVKMQTFPTLYKNATDCFMRTLREEGVFRGLYAGTIPSLAAQVSENAVLFMAYGMCQRALASILGKKDEKQLNPVQNAVAGGCAAFFSSLVLCPTELIKCKLQAMKQMKETGQLEGQLARKVRQTHVGPLGLTKQIIRTEGIQGLFKGLVPTFAREMPGYFVFFGGYEVTRYLLTPKGQTKEELGPLKTVICGGVGGASLWIAVFPADVIKSRVQVQVQSGPSPSFISTLITIARTEGIPALYTGLFPTLLRTVPATGALFLAVETVKRQFNSAPTQDGGNEYD